jgi:L-rhamnose isomerase
LRETSQYINIRAIHRFFAPMLRDDGKAMLAKLTVKETVDKTHKNPLYTVEAVEFKEKSPATQWVGDNAMRDGISPETTRSARDIQSLAQVYMGLQQEWRLR